MIRPGITAALVGFAGFATVISAAVVMGGGSLRAALVTAPIVVLAGTALAGGAGLWRLLRHRRGTDRVLRRMAAG